MEHPELTHRASFRFWNSDATRFADTDRLGHINNAVFATFYETGRVAFLFDPAAPMAPAGCTFVIARLTIDFRLEMQYGEEIDIGTVVLSVGRSSFRLGQALFRGEACVSVAESVLVLMHEGTRKSMALPEALVARLGEFAPVS